LGEGPRVKTNGFFAPRKKTRKAKNGKGKKKKKSGHLGGPNRPPPPEKPHTHVTSKKKKRPDQTQRLEKGVGKKHTHPQGGGKRGRWRKALSNLPFKGKKFKWESQNPSGVRRGDLKNFA